MKRWLAIIISSLLLVLIAYPSAFIYTKDTLPDRNDTRLIAYIIGQVQQNLLEKQPLFYGTFFAPDQNTLAYSDLFLTTSLISLPFHLLTDSPIVIFNLAFILNFSLTIIASYLFFQYIFKNTWTSALTTILFNFSGFHLHYYPHMQIFSLWIFFLAIYFFLRYQNESKNKLLILFLSFATLQLSESIFTFYLLFFTVFILFLQKRSQFKQILLHLLFVIPLWLALIYPYLELQLKYPEATRPITDAAHFSLGLDQLFNFYNSWTAITLLLLSILFSQATSFVRYFARCVEQASCVVRSLRTANKKIFSQGKSFGRQQRMWLRDSQKWIKNVRFFVGTGTKGRLIKIFNNLFLFSLIMSLGPVLKIYGQTIKIFSLPIPLPYALFYYLFPGFQGFRTPSRFIILALFAGCVLIGYFFKPFFKAAKTKTKVVFLLLILSLLFLEADLPLKGYPVNINMHPVYEQVKALPQDTVILELPIKLWNMPDHEIESSRSLYTLEHRHRRLGGYSGFATNSWVELVEEINTDGLNEKTLVKLKKLHVSHAIKDNILLTLP